jgi:hypothetical protein
MSRDKGKRDRPLFDHVSCDSWKDGFFSVCNLEVDLLTVQEAEGSRNMWLRRPGQHISGPRPI